MPKSEGGSHRPSVTNVTKHLQGIDFPASKQDLIEHARKKGVDDSVLSLFDDMDDREYNSMKDVMTEYGKKYEKAA